MKRVLSAWSCALLGLVVMGGCPADLIQPSGQGSDAGSIKADEQGNGSSGSDATSGDELASLSEQLAELEATLFAQVYGDGSAGDRVVAAGEGTLTDSNLQFSSFTVPEGVTIIIQSGATIRCTETFTNNGTIIVRAGADGGSQTGFDGGTLSESAQPADSGLSTLPAGSGEVGDSGSGRAAGQGSPGLSEFESRQALVIGVVAGGGGGAAFSSGGDGGGGMTILAEGAIVNNGTIQAIGVGGSSGAGGGGGGVVILASKTRVTNTSSGTIIANGGAGGDSSDSEGPGGGGGGGIVHLLSPIIQNDGDVSVDGGAAGAVGAAGSITSDLRAGGGGGGATGGAGGAGGDVGAGNPGDPEAAESGSAGFFLTTGVDPTALI